MSTAFQVRRAGPIVAPFLALGLMFSFTAHVIAETQSVGTFVGQSNHITTGAVSIEKSGDGYVLVLADDFDFDGAPDPQLGFSRDGRFIDGSLFAKLKMNKGRQLYALPKGFLPAAYDAVTV